MTNQDASILVIVISLNAIAGILAAASLYVQRKYKRVPLATAEIMFSVWMLLLGSALPLAAINSQSISNRIGMAAIAGLALLGLGLQLLKLVYKSRRSLWLYAAALNLVYPVLLALALG